MLSKKMYNLLKQIPRFPETIPYESLKKKPFKTTAAMDSLLLEAKSDEYNYIYQNESSKSSIINKSQFSLSENGVAALEDYKREHRNDTLVKASLGVAVIAMAASVASAVAAFLALCAK